jgi:trans-2,3-dihydro-3-hydroxyanthranilate isomerase
MNFQFETVDVFTDQKFGGNPLAVFTDARGLGAEQMQLLAAEFNLSERPSYSRPSIHRIPSGFGSSIEPPRWPYAGHPCVGSAFVLSRNGRAPREKLMLEVLARVVPVTIELGTGGSPVGALIEAPQPLTVQMIPAYIIAACIGLSVSDIVTTTHQPVIVIVEVEAAALVRCEPNVAMFTRALAAYSTMNGRFSVHV